MFQIHALPAAEFAPLFDLTDAELAERRGRRTIVDAAPGYPCRVSLIDAAVGERVILINYTHQPADNPYRAAHAIFVREHAEQAFPAVDEVPAMLTGRSISLRAFDADDWLVGADVVDGHALSDAIGATFENPDVVYLHLHNAKPGCYAARATRG
jgi:hypothetical protein